MIKFQRLKKNEAAFQCFTGLNLAAFYDLLPTFEQAYEVDLENRDKECAGKRRRERGGGRHGTLLDLEHKLLFILFYFKFYPVQEVQGYVFDLGQTQAGEWIHRLTPILNQALGYEKQLPAGKAQDIQQILHLCPDLEFIIDGTERPIRCPKNKNQQENHDSGKKNAIRSKTRWSRRNARKK